MSDDDLLDAALRALRESTDGTSVHATHTRADVLARLRLRRTRKRRLAVFAIPIAAALVVGTAWAAATGRLPGFREEPSPPTTHGAPSAATSVVVGAPSAAPVASANDLAAPSAAPPPSTAPSTSTNSVHSTHDTDEKVSAREQALYTKAHQAHFTAHDPRAALAGWNEYLTAFPDGQYALEARYNRAISLVRVGQRAEAVKALTPFARGAYGGYRQAEARDLLDALSDDAGP
jgi:TolA-binding protein